MPLRKRGLFKTARVVAVVGALVLVAGIAALLVLRSDWFYNRVRRLIVDTVETATGGRVEVASFHFDWKHLRADVHGFVLHGREPADKPPLVRAGSVVVVLKLVSILRRDVDIQSLTVSDPHVYLIVGADGRTNFPEPKVRSTGKSSTVEDILKLAIGRFNLERGIFEVETHGRIAFAARGENLNLHLAYELVGPVYHGALSIRPLYLSYDDYGPTPFAVDLGLTMEKNRIAVDSGTIATGATTIAVHGALEDLAAPHAHFQYQAHVALTDIARIFRAPQLRAGIGLVGGTGEWSPAAGLAISGALHSTGVEYRDDVMRLVDFRGDGTASASTKGVFADRLRLSGFYAVGARREAVQGQVGSFALRGKEIEIGGVALTLMGGSFNGQAQLHHLDHYSVSGEFSGVDVRRTAVLYSPEPLPWDALVFGGVKLEGSLSHAKDLRAGGNLTLGPAPTGDAVRGQIDVAYDAMSGALDLGRSTVTLPHSRVDFSGALNSELKVHLETRDLNDLLPALGQSATGLGVKLDRGQDWQAKAPAPPLRAGQELPPANQNISHIKEGSQSGGQAIFDGTVTGDLSSPRIGGHLRASNFTFSGEHIDSLEADVGADSDFLRVQNATAGQGSLRAQFQGSVGLSQWKTGELSPISASATLKNAPLADLGALLHAKNLPVTGTFSGTAQVNGTVGAPQAQADLELLKGVLLGQPFDRFTARAGYTANTLTMTNGQLVAGSKQVRLSGSFQHPPDHFDSGRLRFDVSSNVMQEEEIQAIAELHPGIKGTLQVTASGQVELHPTPKTAYRIDELHADIAAKNVQISGQPLGDAHLTANTQGSALRAHLDSTVAGSVVTGDGEWRLDGEYPGTATVSFSQVDLARLKPWLATAPGEAAPRFAGSIAGTLHIEGPALNWRAMKADLRIPQFQLGPAPEVDIAADALTIRNDGPIVLHFADSTVTVESAHLLGRGTDLNVSGRVSTGQKNPLDLRLGGKLDLGFLQDFSKDFISSGGVSVDATVRGSWGDPQVNGRMKFEKAAFNIADVPNGISDASGTVVFTKDRATIQNLSGETGGGRIELSGFASYGGGQLVFRLHASAHEVRVRYPEGVSTVADASLNLTGTSDSSMLSGTLTVLRTGVNLQSDFSSFLSKSAEPVQTPSAKQGLLGGMSFDVRIQTAPDIQLQSSLTENLQAEANLRLRGTVSNPAVLGRINITQGKLTFFGTKYTISQGSISFYNPVKVEPILNIDLETKARGIDVTLAVSGPLTKLTLTPRSDPPLEFSEIVALLATGRTPTSDPSLLIQQNSDPQSWNQMGASALLGSAIANPVAGRLQRFFGVSKLRIDPTLSGVQNNPQARLTLEQQVTPAITFTYSTSVTQSNPQVVQVEWAFSRQWSAVALREENGLFGVDFFYKRRFK
jgi:translocation and assembly module TamB